MSDAASDSIREERRKNSNRENSNIESIRKDIYSFLESNMRLEELVTKLSKNEHIKYNTTPEYIRISLENLQRERDKHGSVGIKMKVSTCIYILCNSKKFPVVDKEPRTYTEIISVDQDIIEKNKEVNGSSILDVYLTEELAELTQELMKKARNKSNSANLLGEIADVYYTLSMFIQDNNISIGEINRRINFKQDRAKKTLNMK